MRPLILDIVDFRGIPMYPLLGSRELEKKNRRRYLLERRKQQDEAVSVTFDTASLCFILGRF